MAPLHSHDPVKSREKTLTQTQKKRRDEKRKQRTTPAISENEQHQRHKGSRLNEEENPCRKSPVSKGESA